MVPFDSNNFQINHNYVIEASAGTGKTYNIIEIVKKLVSQGVSLDKLLIVTYTDKAAGELKDRIRSALPSADITHASIYTIHSFCQAAIKEFGLSANLPLDLKVINDAYLDDFTDRYIRQGDILDDISKVVLIHQDYNEENLKSLLIQALSKYYLNAQFCEDENIVSLDKSVDYKKTLDFDYDVFTSQSLAEVAAKYLELGIHYNYLINSSTQKDIEFAHNLEETYKNGFYFDGSTFKNTKNSKWLANPDSKAAFEYFYDLKDFYKNYNPNIYLTGVYLKNYYTSWQLEKAHNKEQTLDDLIRSVREEVLKDNSLMLKALREKYSYGIIDEFQDTNRKQYDIFSKIFLNDNKHNLIVVGDPKQSIYSFQGADVNVYLEARDKIAAHGEQCLLERNFRSTGAMVEACNHLFEYYHFDKMTFTPSDYLPLPDKPGEHEALYDGQKAKAFWIGCRSNEDDYGTINERELASLAVKKILDFCAIDKTGHTKLQIKDKSATEFRDVSFKDFAVLARTRPELEEMQKTLKKAGIPFILYKDKGLFKGKECVDWITLCEALNSVDFTGRNRRYFRKALFTNFFGLSLKDIADDKFNYDDTPEMCLINSWKLIAAEARWEDLFDAIMADSGISTRMTSLKDIQSLAIYKQIAQYCIDYLSNGYSLEHLITKLNNLTTHEDEDDEQNGTIIEKNTDFDCVQMMTMHASKGLQFPIVICAGGYKEFRKDVSVTIYHNKDKEYQPILTLNKKDHPEVDEEQIEECKRLYYVGNTRAQFALILPYYEKVTCDFLKESLKGYMQTNKGKYEILDANKDQYVPYDELRQKSQAILNRSNSTKNFDNFTKEEQDVVLKELIAKESTKRCYKHSYSSLSHGGDSRNTDPTLIDKEGEVMGGLSQFDTQAKPIAGYYDTTYNGITLPINYPKGTTIGTALHSVLENLAFDNFAERLPGYIERAFKEQNIELKEEWITSTTEMMGNILGSELPLIEGNAGTGNYLVLKDLDYKTIKTEAEFNTNLLQGHLKNYCNGFIDVIFKVGERYAIIDWKSDKLNEDFVAYNNLDSLKARVDNCYSIQRTLYSYILIKILKNYYPELTEEEIFNKYFGGIYYIFMRGCEKGTSNGVYAQTWESYQVLETSFNNIIKQKI